MKSEQEILHELAIVAENLTDQLASDPLYSKQLFESKWPEASAQLASILTQNSKLGWALAFVAASLAEMLRELVDADVAYVRVPHPEDDNLYVLLPPASWDPGCAEVGAVPAEKDIRHGPCDPGKTSGGDRSVEDNQKAIASGLYNEDEVGFLAWLESEAWIPIRIGGLTRALIVFGKRVSGFFSPQSPAIEKLQLYEKFATAFFHLAEQTEDRVGKAALLTRIAGVLPELVKTPTVDAFWRGVVTLFTSAHGFAFDRALLFWRQNGDYPAVCKCAIGGVGKGKDEPDMGWRSVQAAIRSEFSSLEKQVDYVVKNENVFADDSLHQAVTKQLLVFSANDSGWLKDFLEGDSSLKGEAKRLVHSTATQLTPGDPWLEKVRSDRPGIFCSQHGECFVLPFWPLSASREDERGPTGFLIVDMPYRKVPHSPSLDFPDLRMASLVLQLIAAMWRSREDAESYLHILDVLPVFQHQGKALGVQASDFSYQFNALRERLDALLETTRAIDAAAEFVDNMRSRGNMSQDLQTAVREISSEAKQRFAAVDFDLRFELDVAKQAATIAKQTLVSVLDCIIQNAVDAAVSANKRDCLVKVRAMRISIHEGEKKMGDRISIQIENDGPDIDPDFGRYLFVSRASTKDGAQHRGSGLSNARRQIKACGGDLFLRSPSPVIFEIVLDMADTDGGERADD